MLLKVHVQRSKQGMYDLGWLEGKNVEYQIVYADLDVGSLDALCYAPDLLVTFRNAANGDPAIRSRGNEPN